MSALKIWGLPGACIMSAECICVCVCVFVTDVCTCENHTSHFYPIVIGFVKVPLGVSGRSCKLVLILRRFFSCSHSLLLESFP